MPRRLAPSSCDAALAELAVETVITKPCDRAVLVATIRKYLADTGDPAR